jgi:methylmalonyl-CoA mutase
MSKNMKAIEFPTPTYTDWVEEATKALKGKPFESLFTKTIENITLDPLYTEQQLIEKYGEQLEKQVATIRQATNEDRFVTAQQVIGDTEEALIANLEESLARGNELITIDSRSKFEWSENGLITIADYITRYPFKLVVQSTEDPLLNVFNYIAEEEHNTIEGYVVSLQGTVEISYPFVRTLCADTVNIHNDGANAVQELAYALATASKMADNAESFEQFVNKFFVNFAIDTQFFMEIAKVRAFKVLWKAFTSAYGVEHVNVPVVAETSVRSFSKLDVYVNLLRAGNEALSAAIGGVDVFTIHPHDVLTSTTEQSVRIARNISLVTKEESHVLNVLDPAGGAYFVESLTAELVKEAWALFLQIEEAGGINAYASTFAKEIEAVYAERLAQVGTRKHSLIGTNIYANPTDELPTTENPIFANVKRLAKPFEALRTQYKNNAVNVDILTFGELKNYKPRADFVAGFLAVAGVQANVTDGFQTVEEAVSYLQQTNAKYVVIAATDEDTKNLVPALLEGKPSSIVLDAAGRYKEEAEAWQAAGLNGFIYAGQNIVDKLQQVAATLGEA